jgi:hypothetical protein
LIQEPPSPKPPSAASSVPDPPSSEDPDPPSAPTDWAALQYSITHVLSMQLQLAPAVVPFAHSMTLRGRRPVQSVAVLHPSVGGVDALALQYWISHVF